MIANALYRISPLDLLRSLPHIPVCKTSAGMKVPSLGDALTEGNFWNTFVDAVPQFVLFIEYTLSESTDHIVFLSSAPSIFRYAPIAGTNETFFFHTLEDYVYRTADQKIPSTGYFFIPNLFLVLPLTTTTKVSPIISS